MIATPKRRDYLRPAARIVRAWSDAWRLRAVRPHAEWIAEHVRIPPLIGSMPGPVSFVNHPHVPGVLAAADDPATEDIVLVWSAQGGKTTTILSLCQSKGAQEPAPMGWFAPNEEEMKRNRDDLYRFLDESPTLRRLAPPRWKRNYRVVEFGGCLIYLGFPGNTQRISGRSCQTVFMTELDRWEQTPHEGDTVALAEQRTNAWFRFLRVKESTPTSDNGPIWQAWLKSDQRTFQVPCPHCGAYQELRFFPHPPNHPRAGRGGVRGYKDDDGRTLDPDVAERNAFYECEYCLARIVEGQRRSMLARGVWCPRGQQVGANGQLVGTPERSARVAGFHLSFLYAPAVSFGRAVRKWLACGSDSERVRAFINNDLALPYSAHRKRIEWQELARRLVGGHPRGSCPPGAVFLTCGVDVQAEKVYWVVRAWGPNKRSWLIDAGWVDQVVGPGGGLEPNSDLVRFGQQVLYRSFPLVSPNAVGADRLPIALVGIDSGYGERIDDVHRFVKSFPGGRVRALVGDGKTQQRFSRNIVERNARSGKVYEGGLEQWRLSEPVYQAELQQKLWTAAESDGSWLLCADPLPSLEDYCRQVVNEGPFWTRNNRGQEVCQWKVIDEHQGNHYRDCEKYNLALADMVAGTSGWDEANLWRMAQEARPGKHRAGAADARRRQLVEPVRDEYFTA